MARKLLAYRIHDTKQRIVPGRQRRSWMDQTANRYAYRCLPLTIANAMGWELLLPAGLAAEWNGGNAATDIIVETDDPNWPSDRVAQTHFGNGVITFPLYYLFRTDPGVAVWARGVPNRPKDGIAPLEGIIETDWSPFTFTMNWQFTRPGRVVFEKDEPFCFITLVEYRALDEVTPEIMPIEEEPEVAAQFDAYFKSRKTFNAALESGDPDAVKEGWQKWYLRGESPHGGTPTPFHASKLNLRKPVERSGKRTRPLSTAKKVTDP